MTLSIVWDVSPEIFSIGNYAIRWYGLLFALSFFFGYLILQRIFIREGVPVKLLDELTTYMILGTIVGARLGHVLFYQPADYLANPIDILKIWEGGLASHGAAIGIMAAIAIFSAVRRKPFLWVIDRIVIVVALAGFLIRMGNLMNSEIYGMPTSFPWGFYFLNTSSEGEGLQPRHPTQIYEGFSYLLIFAALWWYYFRSKGKPEPGFLFGVFLITVFGIRFLIEFIKEPQVGFERDMALNMGQWLSVPFAILGMWLIYRSRRPSAATSPTKR